MGVVREGEAHLSFLIKRVLRVRERHPGTSTSRHITVIHSSLVVLRHRAGGVALVDTTRRGVLLEKERVVPRRVTGAVVLRSSSRAPC